MRAYSDHIAHPIRLAIGSEATRQINEASAIWTRPKADIPADQYKEFFGHVSGSYSDPAITLHYKAEGRNEYTVLLFVPGEKPFDLYDPERRGRQKLYVRRVFITDDAELLPAYLRFVRGLVDSADLPLNISRQRLQQDRHISQMRKWLAKKILDSLGALAKDDATLYLKFWKEFGAALKEGVTDDFDNREKLLPLLLFASSNDGEKLTSLREYCERMKPGRSSGRGRRFSFPAKTSPATATAMACDTSGMRFSEG